MSQENVEIVRKSFAAIARGDVEGLLEFYDPDVRFLPLPGPAWRARLLRPRRSTRRLR